MCETLHRFATKFDFPAVRRYLRIPIGFLTGASSDARDAREGEREAFTGEVAQKPFARARLHRWSRQSWPGRCRGGRKAVGPRFSPEFLTNASRCLRSSSAAGRLRSPIAFPQSGQWLDARSYHPEVNCVSVAVIIAPITPSGLLWGISLYPPASAEGRVGFFIARPKNPARPRGACHRASAILPEIGGMVIAGKVGHLGALGQSAPRSYRQNKGETS
jgi:hypothetical protein